MDDWINQIEEDLKWREAEIASFKVLITTAPEGSVREKALLRALWALLYAHFEGFTKYAWDLYLDAIEKQDVPRELCREEVACLSLWKYFYSIRGNLTPESLWRFCKIDFPHLMSQPAEFKIKLETESNLWPNIFEDNSKRLNFSTQTLDEHRSMVRAVVARRNDIAHGKKMVISNLAEYQKYENSIFLVMHELAINVIDSLENKCHLK